MIAAHLAATGEGDVHAVVALNGRVLRDGRRGQRRLEVKVLGREVPRAVVGAASLQIVPHLDQVRGFLEVEARDAVPIVDVFGQVMLERRRRDHVVTVHRLIPPADRGRGAHLVGGAANGDLLVCDVHGLDERTGPQGRAVGRGLQLEVAGHDLPDGAFFPDCDRCRRVVRQDAESVLQGLIDAVLEVRQRGKGFGNAVLVGEGDRDPARRQHDVAGTDADRAIHKVDPADRRIRVDRAERLDRAEERRRGEFPVPIGRTARREIRKGSDTVAEARLGSDLFRKLRGGQVLDGAVFLPTDRERSELDRLAAKESDRAGRVRGQDHRVPVDRQKRVGRTEVDVLSEFKLVGHVPAGLVGDAQERFLTGGGRQRKIRRERGHVHLVVTRAVPPVNFASGDLYRIAAEERNRVRAGGRGDDRAERERRLLLDGLEGDGPRGDPIRTGLAHAGGVLKFHAAVDRGGFGDLDGKVRGRNRHARGAIPPVHLRAVELDRLTVVERVGGGRRRDRLEKRACGERPEFGEGLDLKRSRQRPLAGGVLGHSVGKLERDLVAARAGGVEVSRERGRGNRGRGRAVVPSDRLTSEENCLASERDRRHGARVDGAHEGALPEGGARPDVGHHEDVLGELPFRVGDLAHGERFFTRPSHVAPSHVGAGAGVVGLLNVARERGERDRLRRGVAPVNELAVHLDPRSVGQLERTAVRSVDGRDRSVETEARGRLGRFERDVLGQLPLAGVGLADAEHRDRVRVQVAGANAAAKRVGVDDLLREARRVDLLSGGSVEPENLFAVHLHVETLEEAECPAGARRDRRQERIRSDAGSGPRRHQAQVLVEHPVGTGLLDGGAHAEGNLVAAGLDEADLFDEHGGADLDVGGPVPPVDLLRADRERLSVEKGDRRGRVGRGGRQERVHGDRRSLGRNAEIHVLREFPFAGGVLSDFIRVVPVVRGAREDLVARDLGRVDFALECGEAERLVHNPVPPVNLERAEFDRATVDHRDRILGGGVLNGGHERVGHQPARGPRSGFEAEVVGERPYSG